ncbi:MAG: tripartite tricarboxylate transporter substrate binding protein [Betaproteobacteria bacterium]|nr:tripartite tricarboxylate transporter substrate binding protein [Betaproteobacteria bacterium]
MNRRCALLLLAFAAASPAAYAQVGKWPEKPVRIVVPTSPGGATDRIARMLATWLSVEFSQQFVIDNRAGASGTIGAEMVVRANPDGYTIIVVPSSYATNAALYKLPYDPVNGIAPIAMIISGPLTLTVHPSVRAIDLTEFIELARAKPGGLTYGSPGAGSNMHLAAELFQQMTKTSMIHVPYKGQGPALVDLIGGQVQFTFAGTGTVLPQLKAGKLRGIAVTSDQRSPAVPDLPAISEMLPGYSAGAWQGTWAPAGTPKEIVSRLNGAIARFLKQPDVQARLRADVNEPAHSTPEEFARAVAREIATWSKVVKAGNIKVD